MIIEQKEMYFKNEKQTVEKMKDPQERLLGKE